MTHEAPATCPRCRGFILFCTRDAAALPEDEQIVDAGQEFVIAGQTRKAQAPRAMARGNVKKAFA